MSKRAIIRISTPYPPTPPSPTSMSALLETNVTASLPLKTTMTVTMRRLVDLAEWAFRMNLNIQRERNRPRIGLKLCKKAKLYEYRGSETESERPFKIRCRHKQMP